LELSHSAQFGGILICRHTSFMIEEVDTSTLFSIHKKFKSYKSILQCISCSNLRIEWCLLAELLCYSLTVYCQAWINAEIIIAIAKLIPVLRLKYMKTIFQVCIWKNGTDLKQMKIRIIKTRRIITSRLK